MTFQKKDHPRRCGENRVFRASQCSLMGSPPQVRGKPLVLCVPCHWKGITPAGAGKTIKIIHFTFRTRDHPRRCGENSTKRRSPSRRRGSPPQVRGKQRTVNICRDIRRITPAGAGKTRGLRVKVLTERDHPRRCGENLFHFDFLRIFEGSPPQVRGKRPTASQGRPNPKDHPRRCGENAVFFAACLNVIGSPPQVRGKLDSDEPAAGLTGITPAGAGKTYRHAVTIC